MFVFFFVQKIQFCDCRNEAAAGQSRPLVTRCFVDGVRISIIYCKYFVSLKDAVLAANRLKEDKQEPVSRSAA